MDRDLYLILIGAGISLASSVVTLALQFVLGLMGERMRSKREEKREQSRTVRAAIMDKSMPTTIRPGSLLKRIGSNISTDDLDLPTFLRKKDGTLRELTRAEKWLFRYILPITVGVFVFLIWLIFVFNNKPAI